MEQPPADPWAEDTEVRPAGSAPPFYPDAPDVDGSPSGSPSSDPSPAAAAAAAAGDADAPTALTPPTRPEVGPTGTGVLPPVDGAGAEPRWSARAQVRTPDQQHPDEEHEEWAEPGRGPLMPILVAVVVLLLLGLLTLGLFLLFGNRDEAPVNPTPTTPATTATATTPATSTKPAPTTSAPPTEVAIPVVEGLDYNAAAAKLVAVGLVPKRVDEISAKPVGQVIGTDPPAGNTVRPGAEIAVRVSKGLPTTPAPTKTPTPGPTPAHS